jgi:DNA primase
MFGRTKIEKAKRDNSVEDVIRRYGVDLIPASGNGQLKGRCPFHEDGTPSLSVNPDKGLWNCFAGCGGGSVVDFVMMAEGIDRETAVERLLNGHRVTPIARPKPKKEPESALDTGKLLPEICRIYHNVFLRTGAAQDYLVSRGITNKDLWERFRIGYADGKTLREILPDAGETIEKLQALGILNSAGNESFYKCITIPIMDGSGNIVSLYGRSIEGKRQMYLKGPHRGVWNHEAANAYDSMVLTEAIIDALSLVQLGIQNAVPLYGTNGLTDDHIRLFRDGRLKEIVLCMDADDAGRKATVRIAGRLRDLRIPISTVALSEGIKDPNDFLTRGGTKEAFDEILSGRTPLCVDEPSPSGEGEGLIAHTNDEANFVYGGLLYRIRGLRMKAFDSMRVVVTIDTGQGRHTDRLDLYVAKSRRGFANLIASKLHQQSAKIEEDILMIIEEIESIQQEEIERRASEGTNRPYEMTDQEREEALSFLQDPGLLGRIVEDLSVCGYVGEEIAKKVCYLSATSRITQKPISVIVRSSSAAGKSDLMEKVSQLMPPEEVEFYSRITPQALYYMDKDRLKHKLLIVDERAGSEDADYSIRNLQSREKLTLAVVIKDPSSGKSRTATLELEGPCVIWESTTQATVNAENSSRCFEVWLDESAEQTLRIQTAQKDEFGSEGWSREEDRDRIIRTHRNAQRLLRPLRVEIPFRDRLTFPAGWMRTRRDHKRFLSLIAMIALLHQYQRRIETTPSGREYIEATVGDYTEAHELARGVLAGTLSHITKHGVDLLGQVFEMAGKASKEIRIREEDYTFTRRDIRDWTNWPDKKLRGALGELVEMEYLTAVSGGYKGKLYRYKLAVDRSANVNALDSLVAPEDLTRILGGS